MHEQPNDFATDEFVSKNVRVRPSSSLSNGKEEIKERAEDEDEKKYNSETAYDMQQQRQNQKDRQKKFEESKLLELEKAEKKRKTKN